MMLCCQHCLKSADECSEAIRHAEGIAIKAVILPCSSRVHASQLLKMLEAGVVGIEIVACPEAACQLLVGSRRVDKRVRYVQNLLSSIHENPERVGLTRSGRLSVEEFIALAKKRLAQAREKYTAKSGGNGNQ